MGNQGGSRARRLMMGDGAGISPLAIANRIGWWSTLDTSKLWQDSGRTTPAAADGDPVGAIDDLLGNSRHLTQGTAGLKPTLRLGAFNGGPALQFDGGDYLFSSDAWVASTYSGTDLPLFVMAVAYPTTLGINASVMGLGRASSAVPFRNFRVNSSNVIELANRNDANSSIANDAAGFAVTAVPHIFTVRYDGSTTQLFNENTEVLAPEAATTGATTLDRFAWGCLLRNTASIFWTGYQVELFAATTVTETERIGLYHFFRSRWRVASG